MYFKDLKNVKTEKKHEMYDKIKKINVSLLTGVTLPFRMCSSTVDILQSSLNLLNLDYFPHICDQNEKLC